MKSHVVIRSIISFLLFFCCFHTSMAQQKSCFTINTNSPEITAYAEHLTLKISPGKKIYIADLYNQSEQLASSVLSSNSKGGLTIRSCDSAIKLSIDLGDWGDKIIAFTKSKTDAKGNTVVVDRNEFKVSEPWIAEIKAVLGDDVIVNVVKEP